VKVFGWAADNSGCGWYRMRMPLGELARRGHDTLVDTQLTKDWLDTCDVLVGQRICKTGPTGIWQRIARHPGRPLLVFDLDDDLWNVDPSSVESHAWFARPDVQDRLDRNIQVADLVTVTTEALADRIRRLNDRVVVIPNFVPAAMLDLPPVDRGGDSRVVVGWTGSSTHAMDFADAGPQMARFLERNSAVKLHTIGSNKHAFEQLMKWARRVRDDQWDVSPWFDDLWGYYRELGQFDVATAPLVRHVFNESKSWIKALESAARGLPIVASDVGPYRTFVRHGETGMLVRQPHEWARYLRDLVLDPGMRAEMGAMARQVAAQNTIEGNGHLWEQALLSQLTTSSQEAS
jgi:glycosyltransferase involved in cell wall biosynthesis